MAKGFYAELVALREVLGKTVAPIPFKSLLDNTLSNFRILESIASN